MNLRKNVDWVRARYDELWHLENHDRPLLTIPAPLSNGVLPPTSPANVEACWLDEEYVVKKARFQAENTYYTAETIPAFWPNLGPDIFAALLGVSLKYTQSTAWATHFVEDWKTFDGYTIDPNNVWYRRLISMTNRLVEDSCGDYVVGITDLHTGLDAMTALRGPENLCMDLLDCPELVSQVSQKLLAPTRQIFDELTALTAENNSGGSYNWMSTYCNEPWYASSCDFCTLISGEQFEEFVIPILQAELQIYKNSIFHLDGVNAFRHLDRLLEIDALKGVQLVPGEGEKPLWECVEEIRKIQQHGKMLQLCAPPQEVLRVCEFIQPEGVHFMTYANSPEEADAVVKECERIFRSR